MIWKPNVTVAAVIEQEGKYLLVEEQTCNGILFNQPAGHLEPDESIIDGRGSGNLEKQVTLLPRNRCWAFIAGILPLTIRPFSALLLPVPSSDHDPDRPLDVGILRAGWFGVDEIREMTYCHRSPLVMRCIDDHLAGKRYSLEILVHYN